MDRSSGLIRNAVTQYKFKVAKVSAAFASENLDDQTTLNGQTFPVAVANVCALTQQCLPAPQANIHPNDAGYTVIAKAIKTVLKLK